ncbi:MAG: Nif3-like dinuclear metal center hexameric protein [Oscillospiraceae bacterium]
MSQTVGQVLEFLNTIAPLNTAESYDNVGLLAGSADEPVTGIATCLDITGEIVDEAVSKNANLIVSHHPVIFHPMKRIMADSPVYRLIRSDISAIAIHTNFDMSEGGVNDALMELLGWESSGVLEQTQPNGLGMGAIADLPLGFTAKTLAEHCKQNLDLESVKYCEGSDNAITRVGVCCGSGSDLLERAKALGCQALVTGDVKHSVWIEAHNLGMALIDAGHYGTEKNAPHRIAALLSRAFPEIPVFAAECEKEPCKYI